MRGIAVALLAALALVAAEPKNPQRIVGGTLTTIEQWSYTTALLYSSNLQTYTQYCGGAMINLRSILTAAHCVVGDAANRWRARIGSSYANSGGTVHSASQLIIHPSYNSRTSDYDIALLRSATNFVHNGYTTSAGSIAGANYYLADNSEVWAVGWGATTQGGYASEQLRQVQIWTVNLALCRQRYAELGYTVTDSMICSGWLDQGGRDQCQGDSGGPLIHNGVLVGVCSWGQGCATARWPGVNARVASASQWIVSMA